MSVARVLIVEDEPTQSKILSAVVTQAGHKVDIVETAQAAVDQLIGSAASPFDIVFLDRQLPDFSGEDVIRQVRPTLPNLPIVMLTAQSSMTGAIEAVKVGATDYLPKPASAEKIRGAIATALTLESGTAPAQPKPPAKPHQTKPASPNATFDGLIGDSPAMKAALGIAQKASQSTIPVLIEGESGTGKEMFARAIHHQSSRANKPFIAVNCGAIPENLVESILFGHEKGAFTGATDKQVGMFVQADGGTLFLDELGELPLDVQVKLLRAVQEKEVVSVGSSKAQKVDIRVISATNADLAAMVARGTFREDLYYRIGVFPLTLPPLRERTDDIPALAAYFVEQICRLENIPLKSIPPTLTAQLQHFHWPGNIRQLQNSLFRAVILSEGDALNEDSFPGISIGPSAAFTVQDSNVSASFEAPDTSPQLPHGSIEVMLSDGTLRAYKDIERDVIALALTANHGKISQIARELGLGRSTLYRKMQEYGLEG